MHKYMMGRHWSKPRHIAYCMREIEKRWPSRRYYGTPSDYQAICDHIERTCTSEEIDTVHYACVDSYAKQGRPPGAKNKPRTDFTAQSTASELADLRRAVELAQQAAALKPANGHVSEAHDGLDLSDYVLSSEFDKHEQAQSSAFALVRSDVAKLVSANNELQAKLAAIEQAKPTIVHVKPADEAKPIIDMGLQHSAFPDLVIAANAKIYKGDPLNIYLYGPAGTGKSTAVENLAKVFDRGFRGNGKTIDKVEVLGFTDGYGKYKVTPFREAYEQGLFYCADEIDSWSNEATVALQGALANNWCAFDDKIVARHPNFVFVAAGNTTGKGATIEYVGRTQQDAAFLDRFVQMHWPHDNGLEDAIVSHKEWLAYVRHVRSRLANSDVRNHLVTMRASINGEALLKAGMSWDKTVCMTLRRGLPDGSWDKIK